MDPVGLLHHWLANSVLRPSTQAEYRREVTAFLTWCASRRPPVDALTARPQDIAAWAADTHLAPYLAGRPFDGPDSLTQLAERHPEAARSHDRRITALTQYYEAATEQQVITLPPNLTVLRSGVLRPAGAKNRLDRMERAALLQCIGGWGRDHSKYWQRDQLAVFLLLEGLRPAHVVRVDKRHLYPHPDGTWDVRAPDDHENVGKKFTLEALTGSALTRYLDVRPEPTDGSHALLLSRLGEQLNTWWPGRLVQQIAATHPLLADREPPVSADAVAHTGFWDTPGPG